MNPDIFKKYEKARIIGARALQLSIGAPLLLDLKEETLEEIKFNPIAIARMEFDKGILPITIKRPLPVKH